MHFWNTVAAWSDTLACRDRTFSNRAARVSLGLTCAYTAWIQIVRAVFGQYPYPVLNKLPHPHGFLLLSCIGYAIASAVFATARLVARHVLGRPVRDVVSVGKGGAAAAAGARPATRRPRAKAA
jgi:hypothetical protein